MTGVQTCALPIYNLLFGNYRELAKTRSDVIFGGRLGEYRYYDMDRVICSALKAAENE